MQVISLGKVTVAAAGTPVQAVTASTMAHKVIIEPHPANTGKGYLGTSALNVTTGAGVVKTFIPVGSTGLNDTFDLSAGDGGNTIDVSQFYFDVQTSGQGFTVSYVIR